MPASGDDESMKHLALDGMETPFGERAAEILRQRHSLGVHEMHEEEVLV
jgi:hypothetical protein